MKYFCKFEVLNKTTKTTTKVKNEFHLTLYGRLVTWTFQLSSYSLKI
jgi:hypothetical protein